MNLSSNPFLLHAMCDEYIGDNIGNDANDTCLSFIEHSPEIYARKFEQSYQEYTNVRDFLLDLRNVDFDFLTYESGYKTNANIVFGYDVIKGWYRSRKLFENDDMLQYDGEFFLKTQNKNLKIDNVADEYFDHELFIDMKLEQSLNNKIHKIITNFMTKSHESPLFIPIGYNVPDGGHLVGLILTRENIIITNSGEGLNYHENKSDYISQCIIFLDRPNDCYLYDFLMVIFHMRRKLKNVTINDVYYEIFKLYYIQLINKYNLMEHITSIVNQNISELFSKINNNDIKEISEIKINSEIVFPLWKHNQYYYESRYAFELDDPSNTYDFFDLIFNNTKIHELHGSVKSFADVKMYIVKNISDLLLQDVGDMLGYKMGVYAYDKCTTHMVVFWLCQNISKAMTEKKIKIAFNEDNKTELLHMIGYDVLRAIRLRMKNTDKYANVFHGHLPALSENIEKILKIKPIGDIIKKYFDDIIKFGGPHEIRLTKEMVGKINDAIKTVFSVYVLNEIQEKVNNNEDYNVFEHAKTQYDNVLKNIPFSPKLSPINNSQDPDYTTLNFFLDMLSEPPIIKNNCIVVKRTSKMLTDNYGRLNKSMFTLIPQLLDKIMSCKLESTRKDSYFTREQFAGSCTFNGIFLAVSLMGEHDYFISDTSTEVYANSNKKLLEDIQIKLIEEIIKADSKKHTSHKYSKKDEEIIKLLIFIYEKKNDNPLANLFVTKLKTMLFPKQIENIRISLSQEINDVANNRYINFYKNANITDFTSVVNALNRITQNDLMFDKALFEKYILDKTIQNVNFGEIESSKVIEFINNMIHKTVREGAFIRDPGKKIAYNNAFYLFLIYVSFAYIDKMNDDNKMFAFENLTNYDKTYHKIDDIFISHQYLSTLISDNSLAKLTSLLKKYRFIIPKSEYQYVRLSKVLYNGQHHGSLTPEQIYIKFKNEPIIKTLDKLIFFDGCGPTSEKTIHNVKRDLSELIQNSNETIVKREKHNGFRLVASDIEGYLCIKISREDTEFPIFMHVKSYDHGVHLIHFNEYNVAIIKKKLISDIFGGKPHIDFSLNVEDMLTADDILNVTIYELNLTSEQEIYLGSSIETSTVESNVIKYKRYDLIERQNISVVDFFIIRNFLLNGDFKKLDEYDTTWMSGTRYKPGYMMQLSFDYSQTEIEKKQLYVSNDSYRNGSSDSALPYDYLLHNCTELAKYYRTEYQNLMDEISHIKTFPNNVLYILDKLSVFMGTKDIHDLGYKSNYHKTELQQENKIKKQLTLGIGDVRLFATLNDESTNDINFAQFNLYDNNKIIYTPTDIYLNDHKIISSQETFDVILLQEKNNKKNSSFLRNLHHYVKGTKNMMLAVKNDLSSGLIIFTKKNENYYDSIFYNDPWTNIKKKNNDHEKLKLMNIADEKSLLWVKFDNDNMCGICPKLDDVLTFSLFCEYLLLESKHDLLDMLMPQMVSSYFTQQKTQIHKNLIDFILEKSYFLSPFKFHFLNKLDKLINGRYNHKLFVNLKKRKKYYHQKFTKLHVAIHNNNLKTNFIYYNEWIEKINELITNKNITVTSVTNLINMIIDKIPNINAIMIENVLEYENLIKFIEHNYSKLVVYTQLNILEKIKNGLKNVQKDIEILGNIKYFINPMFDQTKTDDLSTSLKLFQIITGKIIDNTQYDFITKLANDEININYNVYELLMGRGKTSVIIPCIIFSYMMNKKFSNIISCLPTHLLNQSYSVMAPLIPYCPNGFLTVVDLDRNFDSLQYFSNLINLNVEKIILTNDTSIKSFILLQHEKSKDANHVSDAFQIGGVNANDESVVMLDTDIDTDIDTDLSIADINELNEKNKLDRLRRSNIRNVNKFKDDTLIIMDEFDTLLNPMKSDLNFPVANDVNLDNQELLETFIFFITEKLFEKYENFMIYSDKANAKLNKSLIKRILKKFKTEAYDIITESYNKVCDKFPNKRIVQFDMTNSEDIQVENYVKNNQTGGSYDSLILYYLREVYNIYTASLEMMLDKDFGWDFNSTTNPFVAIPYVAQNTPAVGSHFSDPVITSVLTCITYFSKKIRSVDMEEFIPYIKELFDALGKNYLKRTKNLDDQFINYVLIGDSEALAVHVNNIRQTNYLQFVSYMKIYLLEIILIKHIKINPNILNCSFIDVIDPNFISNKFALSGTVNLTLPKFKYYSGSYKLNSVVYDSQTQQLINSALLGDNLLNESSNVYQLESFDHNNEIIEKILNNSTSSNLLKLLTKTSGEINLDLIEKSSEIMFVIACISLYLTYDVIIDVGSFLRNYDNIEMCKLVSNIFTDYVVVCYSEKDEIIVLKNGNILTDYNIKHLKHETHYKIYFDQKHTVGTDLDINSSAKSITFVNNKNSYTEVAQGLYRMREINYYQHNDFLTKTKIDNIVQFVEFIKNNEKTNFDKETHKHNQQVILCLIRKYLNFNDVSYEYTYFFPTQELNEIIFEEGKFDHSYRYNHFIETVDKFLKLKSATSSEDSKILEEIQELLEKLKNGKSELEVSEMRATNVNSDVNTNINVDKAIEIVIETNLEKNNSFNRNTKIKEIDDTSHKLLTDIFSENMTFRDWKESNYYTSFHRIEMFELLMSFGITFTPDSYQLLFFIIKRGNHNKELFYLFSDGDKHLLLTSLDLITMKTNQIDFEKRVIPIDEFGEVFVVNLVLFFQFYTPREHLIQTLVQDTQLTQVASIIKTHFEKYYYYKIDKLNKKFYDEFLNR